MRYGPIMRNVGGAIEDVMAPGQLLAVAGLTLHRRALGLERHLGALGAAAEAPPPYVGAGHNAWGQVYFRVLQDQAAAAALALDNYATAAAEPPRVLHGQRVPTPPGGFAQQVFAERTGRALAVVGDPYKDAELTVLFGTSIPELDALATSMAPGRTYWVLVEPDQGWQQGDDKMAALVDKTRRALVGLSWGTIAGAVVGVGLVAIAARRSR